MGVHGRRLGDRVDSLHLKAFAKSNIPKHAVHVRLSAVESVNAHRPNTVYLSNYAQVSLNKKVVAFRVHMAAALLSTFGREREARKLRLGLHSWLDVNDAKNDFMIFFRYCSVWLGRECS